MSYLKKSPEKRLTSADFTEEEKDYVAGGITLEQYKVSQ